MHQEPSIRTQDLRCRIQNSIYETQDSESKTWNPCFKTKGQEPRPQPEIWNKDLGLVLHTVWTFISQIIFAIWKYQLQININVNIFKSKVSSYIRHKF